MNSPTLADKLGELRVGLRPELEFTRHVFRGEPSYVVRDPITFDTHRFSVDDYRVLMQIRSNIRLSEVHAHLVEDGVLGAEQQEDFYRFILSLHRLGFVRLPFSEGKRLYDRYVEKSRARRKAKLTGFLFLRIPLLNPDRFLEMTQRWVRPLFTRGAFVIWCVLMLIAGTLAFLHREELASGFDGFFASKNLLSLWLTIVGLKVFHESGHAYACKIFGGHVPETGIFLVAFTPCAYVDATASWGFPGKARRLVVCFAGMYFELFIAAAALIAWCATDPGTTRHVLHNIVVLASVVTVGFNANPLMRFDGYYATTDFLEIPNLRQRSQAEFSAFLKRCFLGVRRVRESLDPLRLRVALCGFGVASAIYRVMVVLGISAVIASKFFLVGILLGSFYLLSEVIRTTLRSCRYLWFAEETRSVRLRAVAVSLLVVTVAGSFLLYMPVPARVHASGRISTSDHQMLRTEAGGFLRELQVQSGDRVAELELIARLEDREFDPPVIEARYQVEESEARLRMLRASATGPAIQEARRLEYRQEVLAERLVKQTNQETRAPAPGLVTHCLDRARIGEYLRPGEVIAEIHGGEWLVDALLNASEISRAGAQVGDRVEFRGRGGGRAAWSGTIQRLEPTGHAVIDDVELTQLGGGSIAVDARGRAEENYYRVTIALDTAADHEPRPGMTGTVRFHAESEGIGLFLFRRILTFVNRLALS